MFDKVKEYEYCYIRIFLKQGGKIVQYNKLADKQLEYLLKDALRVELLTDDSFVIITNNNIEILTKSI